MNKEEIATYLENLAKTIRKDSIKVKNAWVEHIPSGEKLLTISIDYYGRECDETVKEG